MMQSRQGDATAGLEPQSGSNRWISIVSSQRGAGFHDLRQRLQGAMGDVIRPSPKTRRTNTPCAKAQKGCSWWSARPGAGKNGAGSTSPRCKENTMNRMDESLHTRAIRLPRADRSLETFQLSEPKLSQIDRVRSSIASSSPRPMSSPTQCETTIHGSIVRSIGTRPSHSRAPLGPSASASPKPWTPRNAAWASIGRPRWS